MWWDKEVHDFCDTEEKLLLQGWVGPRSGPGGGGGGAVSSLPLPLTSLHHRLAHCHLPKLLAYPTEAVGISAHSPLCLSVCPHATRLPTAPSDLGAPWGQTLCPSVVSTFAERGRQAGRREARPQATHTPGHRIEDQRAQRQTALRTRPGTVRDTGPLKAAPSQRLMPFLSLQAGDGRGGGGGSGWL